MQQNVQLEINKPLKYPSNDISICWPSFQTSNGNPIPINKESEINLQISKFSDFESINNQVPKKLETLCSQFTIPKNRKYLLLSSEIFLITKIISFNLINTMFLYLTFYLPYFYFANSEVSDPIYFPLLLFLMILGLYTQCMKIVSQLLQDKHFSLSLLNISILLIYTLCLKINNIIVFTILYQLLFYRNLKFIQKFLTLILFINYQQIIITKIIIILIFQIHCYTCIWGVEFKQINKEDLIYQECFYKSFLMLFFKFDQLDNNHLLILTHIFSNLIIFTILFTIYIQSQSQLQKYDINLKTYQLFLKSKILQFKVKFIIFHYSSLFIENSLSVREQTKKENLLCYIKMKLIYQQLKKFNFLSKNTLNEISEQGIFGVNFKQQKNIKEEINGIYIILFGNLNIEFMGLKLEINNQNIINMCLLQMMSIQQIKLRMVDVDDILYFYINKEQFQNCLTKQIDVEKYNMIKDDINFNNNTEELNIQCYFCNLYHPLFNCVCINIKRRFNYIQTYQERDLLYKRKKKNKIRAGIYQQIRNQGTNNNNISISNSFEVFSDYSSDKQSFQLSVSNQQLQFDQIGKQNSNNQIQKDMLQIDLISDKISGPFISSSLIKQLQFPDTVIQNQSGLDQQEFKNFDSLLDIDQVQEYKQYKVTYNINNVLKILNKQKL